MAFFHNLKLKNRFATRLGIAIRARNEGMTVEEAWRYADELRPPNQEQIEYEAQLRLEAQAKARRDGVKS